MAIDGYFIGKQIEEIKPLLEGAKVRKIQAIGKYQIVFSLFNKGQNYNLLFNISPNSSHFRIIKTFQKDEDTAFVVYLKKVLLNTTLTHINQHLKDRVIYLTFNKREAFVKDYNLILYFEIMGRNSNLILTDENRLIKDAFNKQFHEDKRSILPNGLYEFFPTSKEVFKFEHLKHIDSPLTLFNNYMGFSKEFANYVFNEKVDPDLIVSAPTLYKGKRNTFHIVDLKAAGEKLTFTDTSTMLEYYYDITLKSDDFIITTLDKELKKQQLKLSKLQQELETNESFDSYRILADSIYSSGLNLSQKLSEFNGVSLDIQKTLNENAQKLYRKYRKLKNSITHLNREINLTQALVSYLEDLLLLYPELNKNDLENLRVELTELNIIKKKRKQVKKEPKLHYLKFELPDAVCLVGKTRNQNEFIYTKRAKRDDLWFHVKNYPGAHVILQGSHSEENIEFAAQKALLYSPLKRQKSGEIIYTAVKNTKRITNKPGFYLTYSNESSIYINLID